MPTVPPTLADLPAWVGREIAVSDWLAIDQTHLQLFAAATYLTDADVDLTMSRNNPYGTDLVDGFLLLSLLVHFRFQTHPFGNNPGAWGLNYGLDRVRFLTPVMAGQRLRCRIRLLQISEKRPGQLLIKTEDTLEVEGGKKPAMVAEWLTLLMQPEE
jgi:acyl dehydratase